MIKVLSKREKIFFYTTVGVILFAVIFNIFIAPAINKNDALNSQIRLNRDRLEKYTWLIANKEFIQKKYAKFAPLDETSKEEGTGTVATLADLEKLAINSGVKIVDIRPRQEARGAGSYKENTIELRAEGSLENYMKFIYNLENSLVLLRIKRFQISSRPNSAILDGNFLVAQLANSD